MYLEAHIVISFRSVQYQKSNRKFLLISYVQNKKRLKLKSKLIYSISFGTSLFTSYNDESNEMDEVVETDNKSSNLKYKEEKSKTPKDNSDKLLRKLLFLQDDMVSFTRVLKTFAYSNKNVGQDISKEILTILTSWVSLPSLDPTLISDCMWSMSRVGFRLSNPQHRSVVMQLAHRLCQAENLSPRQVHKFNSKNQFFSRKINFFAFLSLFGLPHR
jgi:hypothetical protein